MVRLNLTALLMTTALGLTACGGGASGGGSTGGGTTGGAANTAPTVDAGANQTADETTTVQLAATASDADGDTLAYSWSQPAGISGVFSATNEQNPEYTLPDVTGDTDIVLTLTVDDGQTTRSDTVVISATDTNSQNTAPTVDAGPNQAADENATIQLAATASDGDGDAITYSWSQPSGINGVFSSTNIEDPSYTLPELISDTDIVLTLTVNDGTAQSTDTVTISGNDTTVPAGNVTISGIITFDEIRHNTTTNGLDYNNILQLPSRGVVVEAIDGSGAVLGDDITDDTGNYSVSVAGNTDVRIRAKAQILQTTGPSWDVSITDNTDGNALYAIQGVLASSGSANSERDLNAASGWGSTSYTGTRAAGPFAILDPIYESVQKFGAVDAGIAFPALEVRWSENNRPASGNLTGGDIGTSFYNGTAIYLLGADGTDTDEYDSHVVTHEWGHYFEGQLSRSDSIGGSHSGSDRLDPRVAFGEGFGNALSGMMLDDPFYRDSLNAAQSQGFSVDVDNNSHTNEGWFNEGSVQSILYDLYDSSDDGADTLSLGLGPIYETLIASSYTGIDSFTSIFPFIRELKTQTSGNDAAIDSLLAAQDINGAGDFGAGETNNGSISSALPVYQNIAVNGSALTVCSVDDAGSYNKLGVRSWVTVSIPTTATYTITMTLTSTATARDPDILVRKAGSLVGVGESNTPNSEQLDVGLTPGTHIIEVYDYNNEEGNSSAGDSCYSLTITR